MEFFRDTQIDFMKYRKVFVPISFALLVLGVVSLFMVKLNVGIDFAGGTQLTVAFSEEPAVGELRALLIEAGVEDAQLQQFGGVDANKVLIKTKHIDPPRVESDGSEDQEAQGAEETQGAEEANHQVGGRKAIVDALHRRYNADLTKDLDLNRDGASALSAVLLDADPDGVVDSLPDAGQAHYAAVAQAIAGLRKEKGIIRSWDEVASTAGVSSEAVAWMKDHIDLGNYSVEGGGAVGPVVGKELRQKGMLAIIMSMVGMLAYIWLRFELRFGIGALVAVVHDVAITLGLFVLGGFEFNLTTIAAFLTVVGYSVNDSVVIFDRVRENMNNRNRRLPVIERMNLSLNQTLSRTLLTSVTTLLAVCALFFLGGEVIHGFAFVVMIGVIVGTYSSVFIACPFALLWENYFGGNARGRRARTAPRPTSGKRGRAA